jgi:hypothetical protein
VNYYNALVVVDIKKITLYIIENCIMCEQIRSDFSKYNYSNDDLKIKNIDELLYIRNNLLTIANLVSMDQIKNIKLNDDLPSDILFNKFIYASIIFSSLLFFSIFTIYFFSEKHNFIYSINNIGYDLDYSIKMNVNGFLRFLNIIIIPYFLIAECSMLRIMYDIRSDLTGKMLINFNNFDFILFIVLIPIAGVLVNHHILVINKDNIIPSYIISMVSGWEIKGIANIFYQLSNKLNKLNKV